MRQARSVRRRPAATRQSPCSGAGKPAGNQVYCRCGIAAADGRRPSLPPQILTRIERITLVDCCKQFGPPLRAFWQHDLHFGEQVAGRRPCAWRPHSVDAELGAAGGARRNVQGHVPVGWAHRLGPLGRFAEGHRHADVRGFPLGGGNSGCASTWSVRRMSPAVPRRGGLALAAEANLLAVFDARRESLR